MDLAVFLAVFRIVLYAFMAGYAMYRRRWAVWVVFTALIVSTYIYKFTGLGELVIECVRTIVAMGLIYITIERK